MEADSKRFGQAAWASATPRLENLKLMVAKETLQLMRAKELCLNHKKAAIERKVCRERVKRNFIFKIHFYLQLYLSHQAS